MFDIITDSACDWTPEKAKQYNVEVVPFYVSLDGEHYRKEGKEIAVRDFYQFMVDNPCPRWRTLSRSSAARPKQAAPPSACALPAR